MNEISIQLTEVNPTIFYGGSKSKNIAILKRYFPKIKIVARGETITAYGEEEILEEFEKQMDRLIMHYGKYNSLDEDTVEKILTSSIEDNFGLDDTDVQKILHGVGGKSSKLEQSTKRDWSNQFRQMIWYLLLVLQVQERLIQVLQWQSKLLKTKKSNESF